MALVLPYNYLKSSLNVKNMIKYLTSYYYHIITYLKFIFVSFSIYFIRDKEFIWIFYIFSSKKLQNLIKANYLGKKQKLKTPLVRNLGIQKFLGFYDNWLSYYNIKSLKIELHFIFGRIKIKIE